MGQSGAFELWHLILNQKKIINPNFWKVAVYDLSYDFTAIQKDVLLDSILIFVFSRVWMGIRDLEYMHGVKSFLR